MKKILYVFYAALIFISCNQSVDNNAVSNKISYGVLLPSPDSAANSFRNVTEYKGLYGYGNNLGYYDGSKLTNQNLGLLASLSGARSVRPFLPDSKISLDPNFAIADFNYFKSVGIINLTAFIGQPTVPNTNGAPSTSPDNRDTTKFPGCTERSKTFKGQYLPIWLDAAKTKINPANTFAAYMYKTVSIYGQFVSFWEIWNEPDHTTTGNGWDPSSPLYWGKVDPRPQDLDNLYCTVEVYNRLCRVSYDVIKTLYPNALVCPGGLGNTSFADAMLRNTDNPGSSYPQYGGTGVAGSITAAFPLRGGAYVDGWSFHDYPHNKLDYWDNANGGSVKYARYSDFMADYHIKTKTDFEVVLAKYGYDGKTFPKKTFIFTETDCARATVGTYFGSVDASVNYIMKCHIMSQMNGIVQGYKYGLGEGGDNYTTSTNIFNFMGVYGNFKDPNVTVANATKNAQWKATATLTALLYGKKYNAASTISLNLPSTIRGGVFTDDAGKSTAVIWAVTKTDLSEIAAANYSFPTAVTGNRYEWDFSITNKTSTYTQSVNLTGFPSFFDLTPVVVPPPVVIPPVPVRKALYTLWDDGTWSNN